MKKKVLRNLPELNVSEDIRLMAASDTPKQVEWYGRKEDKYRYDIYMRVLVFGEIVKAAFFLARDIRLGGQKPIYEVFLDTKNRAFITWDVVHEKWRDAKLDCLDWPSWPRNENVYISEADNKMLVQALGVSEGGYKEILQFQRQIRAEQLERRHKKETDPWDEMMKRVPELPKDWKHWISRYGVRQNYVFYDYSRRVKQEGYCSWCRRMVPIKKPKHNAMGKCSRCGHDIQFKAIGRSGRFETRENYVYLLQRCTGGFVIRLFAVRRWYRKGKHETPEVTSREMRRVIYDENLRGSAFYYGLYKNLEYRWIQGSEMRNGCYSNYYWRDYKGLVYRKSLPALDKKELTRTGLVPFIRQSDKTDPEAYLAELKKKPYLEQVVKAGLTKLAEELCYKSKELDLSSSPDFAKRLGIDKARMTRLRKQNGGVDMLEWLRQEKKEGKVYPDEMIRYFLDHKITVDELQFISDRMSLVRIYHFLMRQEALSGRNSKELISTWKDYLTMSSRLQRDVSKEIFYKPKSLLEAHDEVVKLCKDKNLALQAAKLLEEYPDVETICRGIKEKYEYGDKKYRIVMPERIEEIIQDGQALRHCTSYSDIYFARIQRKESFIGFLRKADHPEVPFYTLEIEQDGTLRQKRTTGDKQDKDYQNAVGFIKKWQKVIQKRLTEEDRNLAKISAKLRVEEFQKLRADNTRIWHGHLKGKLLADVLEADLMEAVLCAEEGISQELKEAA